MLGLVSMKYVIVAFVIGASLKIVFTIHSINI